MVPFTQNPQSGQIHRDGEKNAGGQGLSYSLMNMEFQFEKMKDGWW